MSKGHETILLQLLAEKVFTSCENISGPLRPDCNCDSCEGARLAKQLTPPKPRDFWIQFSSNLVVPGICKSAFVNDIPVPNGIHVREVLPEEEGKA